RPEAVRFNQSYDANNNLVQYCQANYTYDRSTSPTSASRGLLKQIKNSWNWLSGGNWQASTLTQNDYTVRQREY
ncbi:MAG: hypothetical protein HY248_04750, partial [Fimbriimonas ginsengisoli]|nr:hypothetical protein [Fimbriimonas ginsengisoli]